MKQEIKVKWLRYGELPMVYTMYESCWKLTADFQVVKTSGFRKVQGDFFKIDSSPLKYQDVMVLHQDAIEKQLFSSIMTVAEEKAKLLPCPSIVCFFMGQRIITDNNLQQYIMTVYCSLLGTDR